MISTSIIPIVTSASMSANSHRYNSYSSCSDTCGGVMLLSFACYVLYVMFCMWLSLKIESKYGINAVGTIIILTMVLPLIIGGVMLLIF